MKGFLFLNVEFLSNIQYFEVYDQAEYLIVLISIKCIIVFSMRAMTIQNLRLTLSLLTFPRVYVAPY